MNDYTYDGLKKRNLSKELESQLSVWEMDGVVPKLFLHSCCAPCSSYVIEYLSRHMKITVFYYNPNITGEAEYRKRVLEQQRFIREFPAVNDVDFIEGDYEPEAYRRAVMGLEGCEEGGKRCHRCYRLRLEETVRKAVRLGGYDYFSTTLSISPLKDSARLNEIGYELGQEYGLPYLLSDFKKKEGYKRSVELSAQYGLYRQNYCGCEYSKRD